MKELQAQNHGSPIYRQLFKLAESDEFRYIDAFCNTVKHRFQPRQGLNVEITLEPLEIRHTEEGEVEATGGEGSARQGTKFRDFVRVKKSHSEMYPATWAQDIYQQYKRPLNLLLTFLRK